MEHYLIQLGIEDFQKFWEIAKVFLKIVLILAIAWLAMRVINRMLLALKTHLLTHAQDNPEEIKRVQTLGRVFRYIATVLISVITIMEILNELGVSIAPILAAAGVVGVAVGFGAQSLIKDYFTGFFLLLENQIRQGDVVDAGGKSGFVEEVTLRYIKLRDYDGNVHFIPNGVISTVTNMSRTFAFSVIDVRVAFRENVETVMTLMREVAHDLKADPDFNQKILDDLEMAGVDRWDDSAVIIKCRFKVLPLEQWTVRREYLKRLKHAFDDVGIEIPYPHLTISAGQMRGENSPAMDSMN
ncbi:mechanosensitive ion channel family protein [Methylovorus glucosotrophus]|uniref:MscS Mechanosensitive ion channel n=1 Tax=Methylovorus glucosotrophus (strain SIP3-4) TaxID=582744 RepID=C6XBN2_METGS|nr:mechanosensitive ion channel family protein [Methylovorus glucosotrophus]ACT52002.1 MscS Mechanosensitive ion channel [Methylovorus glucosotrophus SIP3-4]